MAYVPIIPIINGGLGWGSSYIPRELQSCQAYYRRYDKDTDTHYAFKEYVDRLKDVEPTQNREGHVFCIYAIEQDSIKERVKYNPLTNRFTLTGELY